MMEIGMPDPSSSYWLISAVIIAVLSAISSVAANIFTWHFGKKAKEAEKTAAEIESQDDRLHQIEQMIILDRQRHQDRVNDLEIKHNEKIHNLQIAQEQCKALMCGKQGDYVTSAQHQGDLMRVYDKIDEIRSLITESQKAMHQRLDQILEQTSGRENAQS